VSAQHKQVFARQAVQALDATPEVAALCVLDAALPPKKSLDVLQRAAGALSQRGDVVGAGARLAEAVAVAPGAARFALALEAARLLRHVNVPEATRLAQFAKENAAQHDEATHLLAELLAIQGHGQEAERTLQACSDQGSRAWWQRVLQLRGVVQNDTGVLEVLREHPDVLVGADAATTSRAARTLANHGEMERAETLVSAALEAPNLTPHDRVLLLKASASVAYAQSDYKRMEATERQVLALAQALGNLRWVDAAYFNRALALEALGDHAGRIQMLELAMQTCVELGDATALAIAQSSYGNALHASA
jgi:tetratricopeptide (TPR) repeat protein